MKFSITLRRCLLLFALLLPAQAGFTAHTYGGSLTSECVSGCFLRVHLRAFRDCSGITYVPDPIRFVPTNSCPVPAWISSLTFVSTAELTPICPGVVTQCSSSSSQYNGVEEWHWYQDFDVCGINGCTYNIEWKYCCRATGPMQWYEDLYFQQKVTIGTPCNNSPVFPRPPHFYIPHATGPHHAFHGAYDPDGDSLAYALIACRKDSVQSITYPSNTSPTQPLGPSWSVTIDSVTGILSFVGQPGNVVLGYVCIGVREYRNGVLIGETMREAVVSVIPAPPASTNPILSGITNVTGGAQALSASEILASPGMPFCFDIAATDPDTATGQTLQLYWDGHAAGATFTEAGNPSVVDTVPGNSPVGRFCWTAPSTQGIYPFLVTVRDDKCPYNFPQDRLILVRVWSSVGMDDGMEGLAFTVAPNPVTEKGRIELSLPAPGEIKLTLHDGLGREQRRLSTGSMPAGIHAWEIDPTAMGLAPGIYFVRLETENHHRVIKLVVAHP